MYRYLPHLSPLPLKLVVIEESVAQFPEGCAGTAYNMLC